MIDRLIASLSAHNDPIKLRSIIIEQRRLIERLHLANAQLRAENRQLRRRLADAELRIVRAAESDALLIGALYFAGLPTSRRACATVGISQWRWATAQGLLRVARISDAAGAMLAETPEAFERGVLLAVERLTRDGLDALRYRLPLCRQSAV